MKYIYLCDSGLFEWRNILLGEEKWVFLVETLLRTFIMFIVLLTGLTLLGKRGVRQLSVFELVVIIGLGSAAGDPMFYKDVGVLPAVIVFTMVIGMYVLITYLVGKSKRFEELVEGKPVCLVKDGEFSIDNFTKEPLAQDEFFAELRMKSVSQLGQVEQAIVETSGEISIFFFPDEKVRYGLSIMPDSLKEQTREIREKGYYACTFCGHTEQAEPVSSRSCSTCGRDQWVKASNRRRIQ